MIEVEVPDGIVEFPDDTQPEQIQSVLQKRFPKPQIPANLSAIVARSEAEAPYQPTELSPTTEFTTELATQLPGDIGRATSALMKPFGAATSDVLNLYKMMQGKKLKSPDDAITSFRNPDTGEITADTREEMAEPGKSLVPKELIPPESEKGIRPSVERFTAGLATPEMLALPESKVLQGLFTAGAASGVVESLKAYQEAKTPEEKKGALTDAALNIGMGVLLSRGLIKEKPTIESRTPTVSETTPPVPPAEMPKTPTESGFYPAIRLVGGETVVGEAGETHPDIIAENKLTAKDIDQRGFVNQDGVFSDREQTAAATGLPTEQEPQRQHSTDLPEAEEPLEINTEAAFRDPETDKVYTGSSHMDIDWGDASREVKERSEMGFVTSKGRFVTYESGLRLGQKAYDLQQEREMAKKKKGEPSASEIETPAEIHGNVQPLEQPAEPLPIEESGGGVQPQTERGIQEGQAPSPVLLNKTGISHPQLADLLESNPKERRSYGVHLDLSPEPETRISEIMRDGLKSGFLNDISAEGNLGWAEMPMSGPRGTKAGDIAYIVKQKGAKVKPGTKPVAVVRFTKDGQTLFEALRQKQTSQEPSKPAGEARPITDEGAMQSGPGIGIVPQAPEWLQSMAKSAGRKLEALRKQIPARIRSRPERHVMDQTADAIDNMAGILGRQMSKNISIGASDVLDRAASAVIAAKFDRANLPDLLTKAVKGKNVEAANAIRYAQANWPKAEHLARKGEAIFDWQLQAENQHGINTLDRDNYLPGVYDTDLWMGRGRPYMISGGGGLSTAFKKGKTYDSPFHAIEEGYVPKTLKLSELIEHRVKQGQRLINRVEWADSLREIVDPTDKKPIVESLIKKKRGPGQPGYEVAPVGYVRRSVIPGVDIAVHEDYAKLFDALTGTSRVSTFEPGGIPIGPAALETAGAIKHGLLLFDTFHVSRIGQKQLSLTGKAGYKKGLTLLEYSNRDLADVVKAGEITQDMADYAKANRPKFNLLLKAGLNVGRIQENMYNSLARSIPGIGTMNKWVFEKMTRGAMAETGLIEFERVKKENPNMSDEQVAQKVSRDINQLFGNLGRQGIFKDPTFQDMARLVFLAPQWVESMARTELRGFKGATIDPLIAKQIPFIQARGSIGRSMRNGLVAYFVGTQLLNLYFRGKFTWQNEEKGHKLDAWIPDVTGKSKGFFLSPFAVFAELTHDLLRYARSEPDIASALSRIVANKLSPFARAEEVLRTGRDWDRQKVIGSWERMRHAAWALAPTPIPLSAPIRAAGGEALYPGQTQRQLTASAGIKTEPAETAQNQIRDLAKDWMKNSPIPAVRARYERGLKEEFGDSDYKPLRTALIKGDYVQARRQLDALLETKSAKTILKTMRPVSAEGRYQPFTGSKAMEVAFVKSLTPKEKELYKEARKERLQLYQRFVEMLKQPNQ